MVKLQISISCIDIGNTISHLGNFKEGVLVNEHYIKTNEFIKNPINLIKHTPPNQRSISYCSVVPQATNSLIKHANDSDFILYNLNNNSTGNFPISYPHPDQIGQDRIANSIAVYYTRKLPCIVIDVGTATTFDIITKSGGYEGGVITPGPQGFLDFLHQNTSLLPKVKISHHQPSNSIGRETQEAMLIGVATGYPSMVEGILKSITSEINTKYQKHPNIIFTGGGRKNLKMKNSVDCPELTIQGLAIAYQLNYIL
jgi:type III pantothenate kinase